MAVTREQIITEVRSWIGTPFHHAQRAKGIGVDCSGLLEATARNLAIVSLSIAPYARRPDPERMRAGLAELEASGLIRKLGREEELLPADFLYMFTLTDPPRPWHFAWVAESGGEPTIIHAYCSRKKTESRVLEQTLTAQLRNRIIAAYRLRVFD
jgi:cell wall-associated NlpC family hydrolase